MAKGELWVDGTTTLLSSKLSLLNSQRRAGEDKG
jgi:hypothetical protein